MTVARWRGATAHLLRGNAGGRHAGTVACRRESDRRHLPTTKQAVRKVPVRRKTFARSCCRACNEDYYLRRYSNSHLLTFARKHAHLMLPVRLLADLPLLLLLLHWAPAGQIPMAPSRADASGRQRWRRQWNLYRLPYILTCHRCVASLLQSPASAIERVGY